MAFPHDSHQHSFQNGLKAEDFSGRLCALEDVGPGQWQPQPPHCSPSQTDRRAVRSRASAGLPCPSGTVFLQPGEVSGGSGQHLRIRVKTVPCTSPSGDAEENPASIAHLTTGKRFVGPENLNENGCILAIWTEASVWENLGGMSPLEGSAQPKGVKSRSTVCVGAQRAGFGVQAGASQTDLVLPQFCIVSSEELLTFSIGTGLETSGHCW